MYMCRRFIEAYQLLCDGSTLAEGYGNLLRGQFLLPYLLDDIDGVIIFGDTDLSSGKDPTGFGHLEDIVSK